MKLTDLPLISFAAASLAFSAPAEDTEASELLQFDVPDQLLNHTDGSLDQEARTVVEHYVLTGDACHASAQRRITMLHIAALAKRPELMQRLIEEGADPQARMQWRPYITGASVLRCVMTCQPLTPEMHEKVLLCLQVLQNAGVDIFLTPERERHILDFCHPSDATPEMEALAIALMRRGAVAGEDEACHFAACGWTNALAYLFASEKGADWQLDTSLLNAAISEFDSPFRPAEANLRHLAAVLQCAQYLLRRNPQLAIIQDADEMTPLYKVLLSLNWLESEEPTAEEERARDMYARLVVELLDCGAGLRTPFPEHGHSCAADHIVATKWLLERLQAHGFWIEAPEHEFSESTFIEQLQELPLDAITPAEIHAHFDLRAPVHRQYRPYPGRPAQHRLPD